MSDNKESSKKGFLLADGSYSTQYKIGDKFVVASDCAISKLSHIYRLNPSSTIVFLEDDGSSCPKFEFEDGSDFFYEYWHLLKPLTDLNAVDYSTEEVKTEQFKSSFVLTNNWDVTGDEVVGIHVQYTDYIHPLSAQEILNVIHSLEKEIIELKKKLEE